MLLAFTLIAAHAAESWELRDLQPKHDRDTVLVVVTPGFEPASFDPLADYLVKKGHDVRVLSFPCLPDDAADYRRSLSEAEGTLPPHAVVAHGLGATLVLGGDIRAEQLALLGPVLGPPRSAAAELVAGALLGPQVDLGVNLDQWSSGRSVDLTASLPFEDREVAEVLLGDAPPLQTCASGPLAVEVQRWYREGPDLDLASVAVPTWVGAGLLDRIAPVEVLVPASRALPERRLTRLGITRLDGRDLDHLGMLRDPIAHKAAHKALRKGRADLRAKARSK